MSVTFRGINKGEDHLVVVAAQVDLRDRHGPCITASVDRGTGLACIESGDGVFARDLEPQSLMDLGTALQSLARRAGPLRAAAERAAARGGPSGSEGQTVTNSRGETRPL